jgi:hypothetical protein
MRINRAPDRRGYTLWLSANDTYNWAHKPGAAWPCSALSGKRFVACVDSNGLCDFIVNGRSDFDEVSGDELSACIADHLPADLRHLWPVWASNVKAG